MNNKRLLAVLQAMAQVELDYDENRSQYSCLFCSHVTNFPTYPQDGNEPHDSDCPIVVAQGMLGEMGMPLLVFKIEMEAYHSFTQQWQPSTTYTTAFSAEEACAQYPVNEDIHNHIWPKYRNVHVTLLREVQR